MNRLIYFFFFTIGLLVFPACEDVIELDLETTAPRLVIESTLDAGNQVATVVITQSNDFYDDTVPEKISGATVILKNETGAAYTLPETEDGIYVAENIEVNPEEDLIITVEIEGELYVATSRVPYPVSLNEIEILETGSLPFGGDDEGSILLSAIWDDPAGVENFYRIRTYVDGIFQPDQYTVLTDELVGDGKEHNFAIRERFEENTTVTIELLSTDENYYDYFFQVSSVAGDRSNSVTPYNPSGNFNKNLLGYFGIYYSSTLSINL